MKQRAKQHISMILVLTMILSLFSGFSLTAMAAEDYEIVITCPDKYTKAQSGYTYGEVIRTSYYSTTCGRNKNVNIQLPANYDENKSYPVLYLLHGVMGSENDMLNYGTTIQNMVADGTAEEMIIVFPNMFSSATTSRPSGFNAATMEGYDNFVNDLVNDLMPFVKKTCSVKEGKENTAVAGFSMGGREALTVGLFRPDLFGYIGAFAPAPGIVPAKDSFMTHPGTFTEDEVKYEEEAPYLITICSGDRDSVVGTFPKSYHELYTKNGIDHLWWEIPGSDHGDPATSSGIYNFCKYAFKAVSTEPQQPASGLVDIDFTDPASADQFEILNQASASIREGEGLYLVTTTDSFEPCNGQLSGAQATTPKDVVLVPVGGNWTATLKFDFDPSGANNGYYQFFGFYAAAGDDYQNLAGIRGGDGAMQNFLRVDGTITADSDELNSEPGLAAAGTYWWRIVKDDTTYTCYRSANGEDFTEMFSYADTGIEAESLVIDAYTGMTQGYAFMVESLEFEGGAAACQHEYEAVITAPTCVDPGYTTNTCALCGKVRITAKTDALGHDWDEGVVTLEPTDDTAGEKTLTCGRCGETKTQRIPPLNDAPDINQLLFTSDFHAGLDGFDGFHNLKALLPLLKEEGFYPQVITNGGDYVEDSYGQNANWPEVFEALESVVKTTYPETAFAWTLGNHDWEWSQMSDAKFKEISGFNRTGMNYANEKYEIYQIGAQGNTTAGVDKEIFWDEDIEAFDKYLASKVGSGKVIFVQTHWPLHRGYNWHWRTVTNAGTMIDTMNKYADDLDIVFLWGHNHYTDEMRNTIVQRGGSISYDENKSKTIKFTYASVGCMNDMYYLHSGHRDTMQGHGVCLSGELQGDKLVLTYNRIDDAYKTVGKGTLTHNADLTVSGNVIKNPAVVEVPLYNVDGSEIDPPTCVHDYKDGVCSKCGEADPNYKPIQPEAGDYVLAETIEAGKQYVIVSNGYALTNKTASPSTVSGTSLAATAVTVTDGIITSEVSADMLWDFAEGSTTQAGHPYENGFFITNGDSKFLSRASSGGGGAAPLNTNTYDASNVNTKPHYAYWAVEELSNGAKAMFLYSTTASDYVFFLRGAAAGFDAPGVSQDNWQSSLSSYPVYFYEALTEAECSHDYEAVVTKPTCTEKGYTTYTCGKCGDTYTAGEVAATGHDYEAVVTEPTCTEKGYTTYTCGKCGDTYIGDEAAATGHDYEAVVTAPTCTEKGFTTYTCSICGDTYTDDEVEATGHDYEAVVTEPTCTEKGFTTYTCACGESYVADEVDALGHKFENGVCTVCGEKDPDFKEDLLKNFVDLPAETNWAYEGIAYCVNEGLMQGNSPTTFNPKGTLSRAELVMIMYRIAGTPEVEYKDVFTDVPAGAWYSDAVVWAETNKVVNGVGDGKFDPNGKITREQIATILYRYAGEPKVDGNLSAFPDYATVGSYAVNAMLWATSEGIITGAMKDETAYLAPKDNATREQIAAIIMRYLEET